MGILADNLLKAKDNRRCSGVVFLDSSKAFDTVNHQFLLRKFAKCGVVGNVHKWLSNYLMDSWQFVQVGDVKSFRFRCLRGVPQGSKLGHYYSISTQVIFLWVIYVLQSFHMLMTHVFLHLVIPIMMCCLFFKLMLTYYQPDSETI